MARYRKLLDSLRRAFPQPVSDQVHDAYFAFSILRALDQVDALKSRAPILGRQTEPDWESVHDFADECFVPLTVGGGITNVEHIRQLLRAGADKVSINTAAYANPKLVEDAARRFGSQCVVASIDARRADGGRYVCYSHSGTVATGRAPHDWARELEARGAGEILLTSIDRDGTMRGYDLELIASVVRAVNVPVIASGGAGNYDHMREAIQDAGASAVAAASMFHFTEQTPAEAKAALEAAGIPVRKNYVEA